MTFIWIIVIVISLLYTLVIGYFCIGWIKYKTYKNQTADLKPFVSIIIAARNEEKNILNLLKALSLQTYRNFEIIIIDDHSTDKTAEIIRENKFINCSLFTLNKNEIGKKVAIATAVNLSKGDLILATDADCIPEVKWVETIVSFYNSEHADFIIGPVKQIASKNIFQQIFSLDFLSLQAVGAGAAEMNNPFLCNGANLAFSKKTWINISEETGKKYASGDDVFFLHNAINILPKDKIRFIFSEDAIVSTSPPSGIIAFFNQRIRWASKAKGYKNSTSVITSFSVLSINILLTCLLIYSAFNHHIIYAFIFLLAVKSIIDFAILFLAASFYRQKYLLWFFVPLQMIYYMYTSLISILSIVVKYNWKDRNCK
ncbi:MAG: glycosyltransferase [Bacteroidia bacterium]|nr:glycosyltransferase [Bacteroidia bacterium]